MGLGPAFFLGLGKGIQEGTRAYFDEDASQRAEARQKRLDAAAEQARQFDQQFKQQQLGIDQAQLDMAKQERERNLIKDTLTNLAAPTDIDPDEAARIKAAGFGSFVTNPTLAAKPITAGPDGTLKEGPTTSRGYQATPFVPPSLKAENDRVEQAMAQLAAQTDYRNQGLDIRERALDQRSQDAAARIAEQNQMLDLRRQILQMQQDAAAARAKTADMGTMRAALADSFKIVPLSPEERAGLPDPETQSRRDDAYNKRLGELSGKPPASTNPGTNPGVVNPFAPPKPGGPGPQNNNAAPKPGGQVQGSSFLQRLLTNPYLLKAGSAVTGTPLPSGR